MIAAVSTMIGLRRGTLRVNRRKKPFAVTRPQIARFIHLPGNGNRADLQPPAFSARPGAGEGRRARFAKGMTIICPRPEAG